MESIIYNSTNYHRYENIYVVPLSNTKGLQSMSCIYSSLWLNCKNGVFKWYPRDWYNIEVPLIKILTKRISIFRSNRVSVYIRHPNIIILARTVILKVSWYLLRNLGNISHIPSVVALDKWNELHKADITITRKTNVAQKICTSIFSVSLVIVLMVCVIAPSSMGLMSVFTVTAICPLTQKALGIDELSWALVPNGSMQNNPWKYYCICHAMIVSGAILNLSCKWLHFICCHFVASVIIKFVTDSFSY